MDSVNTRAKELFTSHIGSTLQMYREGVYEEYKSYNVPVLNEEQWVQELIDSYSKELSIRDWKAVHCLGVLVKSYKDTRILKNVVSFASRHIMSADSIVKLMFAEGIIEILKHTKNHLTKELLYEALQATKIILDDITSQPLIIDPGHELELFDLKDKRSLNLRANNNIEVLKDFLN